MSGWLPDFIEEGRRRPDLPATWADASAEQKRIGVLLRGSGMMWANAKNEFAMVLAVEDAVRSRDRSTVESLLGGVLMYPADESLVADLMCGPMSDCVGSAQASE